MRNGVWLLVVSLSACSGGSVASNPPLPADAGSDVAADTSPATCVGVVCSTPGQSCKNGACVDDCRVNGAMPCAEGTVCNVSDAAPGKCVAKDSGCVITGETRGCGPVICGPGTTCDPDQGVCYATLPCRAVECVEAYCWGTSCACERPPPTCTPAPLGEPGKAGTLNDFAFTRCSPSKPTCDGGLQDLDFDPSCTAWGVTTISGPDHLRSIDPSGKVTEYTGLTDLDMGEVSALRGRKGEFGTTLKAVALTYTCVCGCTPSATNQQGVAQLDFAMSTLPFRIPSTTLTTGTGPFGLSCVDGGPFGLSWGLDEVLYVGNVNANGDYFAADLAKGGTTRLHTYAKRVHASAPFDKRCMLVAIEGGEVWVQPVLGATGSPVKLVTLAADVTSIVRDSWSGRIYAELRDKSIVSFAADGSDIKPFATAPDQGRITTAPDGFVYHVTLGWPATKTSIVRFPMPTKL
jgi:hypothetical protein